MTRTLPDGTTRRSTIVRSILCVFIALWLVVPLVIVIGVSFTGERSFMFPPKSWSLDWYRALASAEWGAALRNSLIIATATAILATLLGTIASFAIVRSLARWIPSFRILILTPQIMPVVVVALGVYLVFLRWNLVGTYHGFILIYTAMALPFVVVPVTSALMVFDRTLERASASLGAGTLATFRQVTLPIIRPAVIGGAVLAFLTAFDEPVIGIYLSNAELRTLPVLLYRSMTDQINPSVAAIAAIEIIIVSIGVAVAVVMQRRLANRGGKTNV